MVGIFSFLLIASIVAFAVAIILLVLRTIKKKPKKSVAIVIAGSVLVFLISGVGISMTYHPTPEQIAERERIAAEKAAEKEEGEREKAEEAAQKEAEEAEEATRREAEEAARREAEEAVAVDSQTPKESPDKSQPVAPTVTPSVPAESKTPAESKAPAQSYAPVESPLAPSKSPPASEPHALEESGEGEEDFIEAHKTDIIVASAMTVEQFTENYKMSLAPQSWTVVAWDDEGAFFATAEATNKTTEAVESVIVVLTPVMDGDRMTEATPHYVSVGDVVYGDDGYCDDVFSILEEILGS